MECKCSSKDLFNFGCKCGSLNKEAKLGFTITSVTYGTTIEKRKGYKPLNNVIKDFKAPEWNQPIIANTLFTCPFNVGDKIKFKDNRNNKEYTIINVYPCYYSIDDPDHYKNTWSADVKYGNGEIGLQAELRDFELVPNKVYYSSINSPASFPVGSPIAIPKDGFYTIGINGSLVEPGKWDKEADDIIVDEPGIMVGSIVYIGRDPWEVCMLHDNDTAYCESLLVDTYATFNLSDLSLKEDMDD